ncbi:MAG: hypothetical protein CL928_18715 [Deltaproteobacteria bacterium]|nr:hypothetical protein [Deltaproteobacteria bacterium]
MDALRMWRDLAMEQQPVPRDALELYRQAIAVGFDGRWDEAEPVLVRCLPLLEEAGVPEAAAVNHNLAALLMARGDRDGAIFHCIRGLFIYNKAGDVGGLYCTLRNLAIIHEARGEKRLARTARHETERARRELQHRGQLRAVEVGRDSRGEPLRLLKEPRAGSRSQAI